MLAGLLPIEVLQNGALQFGAMQRRAIMSCSMGAGKASAKCDCNCVMSYRPCVHPSACLHCADLLHQTDYLENSYMVL